MRQKFLSAAGPLVLIGLLVVVAGLSGCVNVKGPERIDIGGEAVYSPPPTSVIPPADPSSSTDLRRENTQLRQRIAWLEGQNRKLDKKLADLQKDIDSIRADMNKIAAERDRYKKAAGQ